MTENNVPRCSHAGASACACCSAAILVPPDAMPDALELLHAYLAEQRRTGAVDPSPFLDRAETTEDGRELAALIDAHLSVASRQAWDPEAFRRSVAAVALADGLERSVHGVSGTWPTLLPRLRQGARLPRRQVVSRLAQALGAGGEEERSPPTTTRWSRGSCLPGG